MKQKHHSSGRPSHQWAKPPTIIGNDKRTICRLLTKLLNPFTTMDDVHLSKHVLMSISTYPPTTVVLITSTSKFKTYHRVENIWSVKYSLYPKYSDTLHVHVAIHEAILKLVKSILQADGIHR